MKIEQFTPVKGRLVIKKTKELTKTVEVERPDMDNPIVKEPQSQGPGDLEKPMPVVPTKMVKEKVTRAIQIGEVVAAHPEEVYSIGDKVTFGIQTLKEFDLIPGKYGILEIYNVLGTVRDKLPETVNDRYA